MDPAIPQEIRKVLEDAEDFLAEALQDEPLSARARQERDAILLAFRRIRSRYRLDFASRGEDRDGPEENPGWNSAPPLMSEAEFPPAPPEFQDDGLEEIPRPVQDPRNILKQGYLEKRSRDPGFFGSEWHKRWCVLTQRSFLYFSSEKSKQPKGTFSIENYSARLNSQLRKDSRKKSCFELICPGKRSYEFTAPSAAEAQDWVEQIQFLLKDLTSLTIPCDEEEEEEEELSSNSMENSHNSTLNAEEPIPEPEGDDIYEVLPDEELEPPFPEDEEDFGIGEEFSDWDYSHFYQGLWDCRADNPDELSFHRGDLIRILSKEYPGHGWWVAELREQIGIVPREFLTPAFDLDEP